MDILNRYVARSVASATFVVLVAFVGIELIFRIVDESANIYGDYTFAKTMVYEGLRTFSRIYGIMPEVGLIGCLTGLGALATNSELIVMRAAGVSNLRLVWIALRPAMLFMVLAMVIGEEVAPKAEQMAASYRAYALHQSEFLDMNSGLWLRDGNDYVYASVVQPKGIMLGLDVFRFNKEQNLVSILRAEKATFKTTYWLLEDVDETFFETVNGMPEKISQTKEATRHWENKVQPSLINIASVAPVDLKTTALWNYINYLKEQNLNSAEYEVAFWQKIFYPIVMISLVLVGISFVFGPLRQVTMGYRVFTGVLIGIVFKTVQDTLGPLSIVYEFSPIVAMLIPALLCAFVGVILIVRVR